MRNVDIRNAVRKRCDTAGEVKVKELLKTHHFNPLEIPYVEVWLEEQEQIRQNNRFSEELGLAKEANKIALIANDKSDKANRISWWAIIISLLSIIVYLITKR